MLGKDLSNALSGIADDKIESAMNAYARRKARVRQGWLRFGAVAATLAILLTAALWPGKTADGQIIAVPGVMKVYAYDAISGTNVADLHSYDLNDDLRGHRYEWSPEHSSLYGLPLSIEVSKEELTEDVKLEVEVDHGSYYGNIYSEKYMEDKEGPAAPLSDVDLGSKFTIDNGEAIFWTPKNIVDEARERGMGIDAYLDSIGREIYTDIIIRSGGNIVGYTVICFAYDDGWYYAQVVKTVRFPMVDGEYQEVTEEYVRKEMSACRSIKINDRGGVYHSARGSNESIYGVGLSSTRGIRYTCKVKDKAYADKTITFEFSTNYGRFWSDELGDLGSDFTVHNEEIMHWKLHGKQLLEEVLAKEGGIYADVIIRADNRIIGYAVISIDQMENEWMYTADKCKTVFLEDEKSEEEVRRLVAELREELK